MLPEVFEEFQVVYVFLANFCFSLSLSMGKSSTLEKIWGAAAPPYSLTSLIDNSSLATKSLCQNSIKTAAKR